ncbi:MAG: hypothetical protein P9X27_00885 [Candidatus Kaelpia aquatica]|nr:hypothetical protein [Candidatus Kaelpia aquatica]
MIDILAKRTILIMLGCLLFLPQAQARRTPQIPTTISELRQKLLEIEETTKIHFSRSYLLSDEKLTALLQSLKSAGRGVDLIGEFYNILLEVEKTARERLGEDINFSGVLMYFEEPASGEGWEQLDITKDDVRKDNYKTIDYNIRIKDLSGDGKNPMLEVNLAEIIWILENRPDTFRQQIEGVLAHEIGHIPLSFLPLGANALLNWFPAGIRNPYIFGVQFVFNEYWDELGDPAFITNSYLSAPAVLIELIADRVAQYIAPESHKEYVKTRIEAAFRYIESQEDVSPLGIIYQIIIADELGLEDLRDRLIKQYRLFEPMVGGHRILLEKALPDLQIFYRDLRIHKPF